VSVAVEVDFERRFGGVARLYGQRGAEQIWGAHVVVVGIGGVGSWVAEALARSGVGRISLIDMDHIAESNINRQIHALDLTLGQSKIEAMQARIARINSNCQVHLIDDFVTPQNWQSLVTELSKNAPIDAVVDACDQANAKLAMAAWALASKVKFITIGAAGGKQQAELVQINDLVDVTHDPLLAKLRYSLRREHGAARQGKLGVACVYSKEEILPPQNQAICDLDGSLNCHGFGSCIAVTATFGMCAAGWITKGLATSKKVAL
jgi:tRNA threonylcarbamoyladenosine dehydratase